MRFKFSRVVVVGLASLSLAACGGVSDSGGNASTRWTLGTTAGSQHATATVAGLAPVSFSATAVAGNATASVTVTSPTTTPYEGDTVQLTAIARDQFGNALPNKAATWSSSNPTIAPVSASGVLQAWGIGDVTVAATVEAFEASSHSSSRRSSSPWRWAPRRLCSTTRLTDRLDDPSSWRAGDGGSFGLRMMRPYVTGSAVPMCTFLSRRIDGLGGGHMVYSTYLSRYMLVAPTPGWVDGRNVCGYFFSLSTDLIHCSEPQLLAEAKLTCRPAVTPGPGGADAAPVLHPFQRRWARPRSCTRTARADAYELSNVVDRPKMVVDDCLGRVVLAL